MKRTLLYLILISLITINPRINGWNEASRMALTQSLVEEHNFKIDNSDFADTGDKVFVDGHFYSDKPPLPSIIAALVYWPLYQIGLRLSYGWNLAYYLIILFTIKLFWVFSVLAFKRALSYLEVKHRTIDILVPIFAFGSIMLTWSATFNNHSLAASSIMIAFMFYLKSKSEKSRKSIFASGFFFGLAGAMDIPTGIFFISFGLLLFDGWKISTKMLPYFIAGLIPLILHFWINYSIGHTLLPLQIVPEYFDYEGTIWRGGVQPSGMQPNSGWDSIKYGLSSLLGLRGFLLYNPLLFIAIPLLIKEGFSGQRLKRESRLLLVSVLVFLSYYFIYTTNYGGWSYSIRWFVPLLPFFMIYLIGVEDYLENRKIRISLGPIAVVSMIISSIGLINPWSNADYHSIPFMANVKQLIHLFF
ncbi:MAG: hypothetical protein K9N35_09300 [Candidatus Marinimicrobia bacterium]|nr:hypothetical protein [Candidatus Neomarinimicrobiota bacterium]